MMALTKTVFIYASLLVLLTSIQSQAQETVSTIESYNQQLPVWGASWRAGSGSVNGYYPSFYTGFAPRVQSPERIHIRISRGNQTRLSVILDDQTTLDYLFDLNARKKFYNDAINTKLISISPRKSVLIPHATYFSSIVEKQVAPVLASYATNKLSKESLYSNSMKLIKNLNPGRVFDINLDLSKAFLNWRDEHVVYANEKIIRSIQKGSQDALVLVNKMLWGRVNLTRSLSDLEKDILEDLYTNKSVFTDEGFVLKSFELFKSLTGSKYQFKILKNGAFANAMKCEEIRKCILSYTELSAIYPTGTLMQKTKDDKGNKVNKFGTAGLAPFLDRRYHEVDHIRKEPYYGFAPKMDYESIGNGFHNPAVRLWPSTKVKEAMSIPKEHKTYWPVKRGGVSNGCARLPIGHIWEMRHIMPVQNELMKKVFWFGNEFRDFDVFDINADGSLEVMGVKYYVEFGLKGSSGLAKREGEGLDLNPNISRYYSRMYGERNIFREEQSRILILNPTASIHTINDRYGSKSKKKVKSRQIFSGEYALYEQDYEQDKIQFYTSSKLKNFTSQLKSDDRRSRGKRFARLMGRVRGCAPFSDKEACGETAFKIEKAKVLKGVK